MAPGGENQTVPVEPIVLRNADGRLALEGRTALVTGGGSGIGRAAAVALARNGANVLVAGRRAKPLEETVAAIEASGGSAAAAVADVVQPDTGAALVDAAVGAFGSLDIVFNNAGYQEPRAPLAIQDPALFDPVFDTNVRALFQCMASQIAHMVDNGGGVIINNGSVSGVRNPNAGLSLYSASKAAAISLTRSAAMEYAERHVRINLISPGRIVTEMMLNSGIADMETVGASLPVRRMGNPMEVANGVVWLASDASSFTVGHNLITDGGFLSS